MGIVRDEHGSQIPAAPQTAQHLEHFFAGPLIEIARGLVRQQQRRVANQGPRDRYPLLFSARKLSRAVLGPICQSHLSQSRFRLLQRLCPVLAGDQPRHHHVFRAGKFAQQMMLLPDVADLTVAESRHFRFRKRSDIPAVNSNRPACGPVQPRNEVKKRTFPGAAFPHYRHLLARRDFEIQVAKHHDLSGSRTVSSRQLFQLDNRRVQTSVYRRGAWGLRPARYPQFCMVNWLVIGIGDITRKRVIPAIQEEPRSVFHSVLTRNPDKAAAYPGVQVHTSLESALTDPEINAVYVATPVGLHARQTIASLQAGKHVLCEKPTAMTYAEAETMAAAGRDSGRLFGVSFYRRLYPKLIRAKQLIAEGAIGKPVLAEANNHGWLEAEERAWLRDPELAGGGPLYDTGSHRIDAFNFLFGKPLSATGVSSRAVHSFGVADSATVLVQYPGGLHGVVDVRWTSHIVRDQFRIVGTEGELDLTPLNGPTMKITTREGSREESLPAHRNVHYPLIENFVQAILDGTPLTSPGEGAILTDWVTSFVTTPHPPNLR